MPGLRQPVIKYIGSKRRLVPVLGDLLSRAGAATAVDLFTGTTRVAQEWKRRGAFVTAVDSARYSAVLAECYIATDAGQVDRAALGEVISHLQALPGTDGYVTETFSRRARYFQEANARRIDAIRDAIEAGWADHPWRPILLTSLLLAADRVDSTTGLQMAYLKEWSPRSYQPLELRVPASPRRLRGRRPRRRRRAGRSPARGRPGLPRPAVQPAPLRRQLPRVGDAGGLGLPRTTTAWRASGWTCGTRRRRRCSTGAGRRPTPWPGWSESVRAEVVLISGSDEGWVTVDDLADMAGGRGAVEVLAFDSKRYVGAQIGIHDPTGKRVGQVGRTRNTEYLVVAGPARAVARLCAGYPARRARKAAIASQPVSSSRAPRSVEGWRSFDMARASI